MSKRPCARTKSAVRKTDFEAVQDNFETGKVGIKGVIKVVEEDDITDDVQRTSRS